MQWFGQLYLHLIADSLVCKIEAVGWVVEVNLCETLKHWRDSEFFLLFWVHIIMWFKLHLYFTFCIIVKRTLGVAFQSISQLMNLYSAEAQGWDFLVWLICPTHSATELITFIVSLFSLGQWCTKTGPRATTLAQNKTSHPAHKVSERNDKIVTNALQLACRFIYLPLSETAAITLTDWLTEDSQMW